MPSSRTSTLQVRSATTTVTCARVACECLTTSPTRWRGFWPRSVASDALTRDRVRRSAVTGRRSPTALARLLSEADRYRLENAVQLRHLTASIVVLARRRPAPSPAAEARKPTPTPRGPDNARAAAALVSPYPVLRSLRSRLAQSTTRRRTRWIDSRERAPRVAQTADRRRPAPSMDGTVRSKGTGRVARDPRRGPVVAPTDRPPGTRGSIGWGSSGHHEGLA